MMKRTYLFRCLSLSLVLSASLLSGCSGLILGDENLAEAVDLPDNPGAIMLKRQWQRSIGDGTDEKALKLQAWVAPRYVYAVSADGVLSAVARQNGALQWRKQVGHAVAAGVSGSADSVIIGSENGLLMAFSGKDGSRQWSYQLSTEIMTPPTVVGGLVVARTIDGQVTALAEKNGQVVWKQNIGVADLSIRGNARSLFLDGVLLFTNGKGRLTLLAAKDGKPVLDMAVTRGRGITAVERVADLLATPVVRNGVLYLSAYRHETLAINLQNGNLLWRSDKATALDLFADNRYVYIADKNSRIYALEQRSGKVAWTSHVAEGRRISPLSGNGRHVVTVDNEGKLLVLDSNNGRLLGYSSVGSERSYVAPQWVDGKWLTYTGNGKLTLTRMSQP